MSLPQDSAATQERQLSARKRRAAQIPGPSPARLREFYAALLAAYGAQGWWPARTPLEVVVGAYLTQNTAWKAVERSIANLESQGLLTLPALLRVPEEELQALIRPSGYMVRKAAAILAFVRFLKEQYGGSLEALAAEPADVSRPKLLALPGVGPETADAILLYALGQPVMVVDEYLRRVTHRHRLIGPGADYGRIQTLALRAFAADPQPTLVEHYGEFHALIVEVGKRHCGPQPRCEGCPLAGFHPRPRMATRKPR